MGCQGLRPDGVPARPDGGARVFADWLPVGHVFLTCPMGAPVPDGGVGVFLMGLHNARNLGATLPITRHAAARWGARVFAPMGCSPAPMGVPRPDGGARVFADWLPVGHVFLTCPMGAPVPDGGVGVFLMGLHNARNLGATLPITRHAQTAALRPRWFAR